MDDQHQEIRNHIQKRRPLLLQNHENNHFRSLAEKDQGI
jgi:hypothetical protein